MRTRYRETIKKIEEENLEREDKKRERDREREIEIEK